jgi:soluble lytic murein transglycosylase-like protein
MKNRLLFYIVFFFIIFLVAPMYVFAPSIFSFSSFLELTPKVKAKLVIDLSTIPNSESVSFIKKIESNKELLYKIPSKYRVFVIYTCKELDIPLNIFYNLIYEESRWKATAINRNKNGTMDRGLMQLNSRYQSYFVNKFFNSKFVFDIFNPYHNIEVGANYLKSLHNKYGNWKTSIMAYNCGPGNVDRNKIPTSTKSFANRIFKNVVEV